MPNLKTAGAAVRTFPVLLKWGLCTRPGIHAYPIGGSRAAAAAAAGRKTLTDEEKRACVRDNAATLYHDLGVLAFDGCSYGQAQRVGDILARAVALGTSVTAAGSVATAAAELRVSEDKALEAFELFPELWRLEEETWGPRMKEEGEKV